MVKQAKGHAPAPAPKTPKGSPPPSAQEQTPLFCFYHADRASKNAWAFKPSEADAPVLFDFVCDMGHLKWGEIVGQTSGGHKKHHSQPINSIESAAQGDLKKRKLDEMFGDEMFRFRLSGPKRLWGFRAGRTFHVVWWDPNHAVYPTEAN